MSVGFFIGPIRSSYVDEAQDSAASYAHAIDKVLKENGLAGYKESDSSPDVYKDGMFGRSALDHHSASCLIQLGEMASNRGLAPHASLLAQNPYRVTFVPVDFPNAVQTGYSEQIAGELTEIWVGSLPRLRAELVTLASELGIPISKGELSDEIATKINDFAPLFEGDDCSFAEDERTAWLVTYEGARLALEHKVALSLAG